MYMAHFDELLRFDLEALAAALEQAPFPAHEDSVAVKPAAETADSGGAIFFARGSGGGVLLVPALVADVVAPKRQLGSCPGVSPG